MAVQELDIAIHHEFKGSEKSWDLIQAGEQGVEAGPMVIIRHKGAQSLPHCNSVYVTRQKGRVSTAQHNNLILAVNWFLESMPSAFR